MVYVFLALSIVFMSAAQLLLKRGLLEIGPFPADIKELILFYSKSCTNIYIIFAVVCTLFTAFVWFLVASKAQISFAYPFMALSYILVALFSLILFKEDVSLLRWIGIIVICTGVFLISRS